jgi:fucose 4-O-acetylase-like acetyltransferase
LAAAAPTAVATPSPDVGGRDPWFDNAKFGLIILVVVGHVIGTFRSEVTGAGTLYLWIYAFHMPAFVFIAGFFSKGTHPSNRRLTSMFTQLLVPYVVFQTLFALWTWRAEGASFEVRYFTPYWIMWFLLAVFIWRMAAPLLQRLRYPLSTSVGVALLAGLLADVDRYLTLHRVLALLPYFVLGLVVQPHHLMVLRRGRHRIVLALAVLTLALPAAWWASDNLTVRWFYHRTPYVDLGPSMIEAMATRGVLLIAGVGMGAAFLALVPQRRSWVTPLGEASMYPYLLHGFSVLALSTTGIAQLITTIPSATAAVLLAIGATILMSIRPVRWLAKPLVAPPVTALFTPRPSTRPRRGVDTAGR